MIADFLDKNAYLAANLFYLIPVLASLGFLSPRHRKIILVSGLASAPVFPLILLLEGTYWTPQRLGGLALGLEDALCSFAVGALAGLVSICPFQHRITMLIRTKTAWCRYIVFGTITVGIFFPAYCCPCAPHVSSHSCHLFCLGDSHHNTKRFMDNKFIRHDCFCCRPHGNYEARTFLLV